MPTPLDPLRRPAVAAPPGDAAGWRPQRTIVLVGMPGSGKSSVGRRLAARLGLEFRDSDREIELAAGMTVAEIFERHGEAAFRAGERRVIARLLAGPIHVLATGGGAFIDGQTRIAVRAGARSVWLQAALPELLRRVARRSHRPLLHGADQHAVLSDMLAVREPIYATADLAVCGGARTADHTADQVLDALERFERGGFERSSGGV